jgi:hypothetical protein
MPHALAAHGRERRLDLGRRACFQDMKLHTEAPGQPLCLSQHAAVGVGVLENGYPRDRSGDFEHLQLLSHQVRANRG